MRAACFATCLMDIDDRRFDFDFRIKHFKNLAAVSEAEFVVFTCGRTFLQVQEAVSGFGNVQVVLRRMDEFELYPVFQDASLPLPEGHNPTKDTRNYMTLMNLKLDMVAEAMRRVEARNYGWVDFSITYICPDSVPDVQARLKQLAGAIYSTVLLPGCTPKDFTISLNTPCWRFCGGFFIGDAYSISNFCQTFKTHAPVILQMQNRLMWEVNIWAFLERDYGWCPTWVKADHDLSIFPVLEHV
jgi:hypothetical protein